MRLKYLNYGEFHDTPQDWRLEKLSFGSRMLIVGKNTAGKSRSLSVIAGLARHLIGAQPPSLTGDYVATFDNDGIEYRYELKSENFEVVHERIEIDGNEHLIRGRGGAGKIRAEKVGTGEPIEFQAPPNTLAAVARRDAIQHSFIEPLFDWAQSLRYYQFGGMIQGALAVFVPLGQPVDDRDQNAVVAIYREGEKRFGPDFAASIQKDLSEIDYAVDSIGLATPSSIRFALGGPQPVGITIKERDLRGITDQIGMSAGMFRVLALLVHVNFAQFNGSGSSVLIDDIGEGLDFDRSCRLIELLRAKAATYNFQLVMTTNDKFVMNHVPLDEWTVLHRTRSVVHVRNYENSRPVFDDFKFTGLSNFSFFEMNAVEINCTVNGEGEDA